MSQVDYLLMVADAARLAAQHPELDEELIQGIWRHLLATQGRQPTLEDVQAYIDRVSNLDERTIRLGVGLGLRAARRRRNRRTELGPRVTAQTQGAAKISDHREAIRGPGRTELDDADGGQQIRERIGIEQARSKGGPPSGGGLTRDDIIDAAIEHREPDGTWPTQTTVSVELGKDEAGRRIRQVQGPRGWAGVLEDAEARLANR